MPPSQALGEEGTYIQMLTKGESNLGGSCCSLDILTRAITVFQTPDLIWLLPDSYCLPELLKNYLLSGEDLPLFALSCSTGEQFLSKFPVGPCTH
jgi:hypothetical protein